MKSVKNLLINKLPLFLFSMFFAVSNLSFASEQCLDALKLDLSLLSTTDENSVQKVKTLLSENAEIRIPDLAMHVTIIHNNHSALEILSEDERVAPNILDESNYTPLMVSVHNRDKKSVKILSKNNRVDPDIIGPWQYSPLSELVSKNGSEEANLEIMYMLLNDLEADPNIYNPYGNTILNEAILNHPLALVSLLADYKKTNVNFQSKFTQMTPLITALNERNLEKIEFFIDHPDVDPDVQDELGMTPLMYAAIDGEREITQALLDKGAKPNIQDINGRTALMHAIKSKNNAFIPQILLEDQRVDVEVSDSAGKTAIMYAAIFDQKEIVQDILHRKIGPKLNIDLQDKYGLTALAHAVINYNHQIVEILLELGANPNIKDVYKRTTLDLAEENNSFTYTTKLLKQHNAVLSRDSGVFRSLLIKVLQK